MYFRTYVMVLAAVLTVVSAGATDFNRQKRFAPLNPVDTTDEKNGIKEKYVCSPGSACGWTIYFRFTRQVDYFKANPECKCHTGENCWPREDNMSIPGYVHYCSKDRPQGFTSSTTDRNDYDK